MKTGLRSLFYMLMLVSLAGCAAQADRAAGPEELARTWRGAKIYAPAGGPIANAPISGAALSPGLDLSGYAAVVYAHGCIGLSRAAQDTGFFLSRAGYIVIQPDSFARQHKPQSCDPTLPKGGFHRAVLGWRQAEIDFAIKQLKSMGPRGPSHIFLMGLSEGAITTATYRGETLSGRIIEGWTCHAGWPEYKGLISPPFEPVLSLVADRDPWFTLPVLQGDCGAYMTNPQQSKSVVFTEGSPLRGKHWLSFDLVVQKMVLDFLAANLNRN